MPDNNSVETRLPSEAFVTVRKEDVTVTRLAPAPMQLTPLSRHEARFLKAISDHEDIPTYAADAVRSLSRVVTEPTGLLARLLSPLDSIGTAEAELRSLETRIFTFGALPGFQPRGRATGISHTVPDPIVKTLDGGSTHYQFANVEHVRSWVRDSFTRSFQRGIKANRHSHIASTGVRKPVQAEMARFGFDDGAADQWVPIISDGITRWTISVAGCLGVLEQSDAEAAKVVIDTLLPANALSEVKSSKALVVRWGRLYKDLARAYATHESTEGPDADGIMIRQFATLPTTMCLYAADSAGNEYPMDRAMRSIVGDTHTDVEEWDTEDEAFYIIEQAIGAMADRGQLTEEERDLWLGRREPGLVDELFPPSEDALGSPPELRRAVQLFAFLIHPAKYDQVKRALRDLGRHGSLRLEKVMEYLSPLAVQYWVANKGPSRIWAYGGPIPAYVRNEGLEPEGPANYLDLVPKALQDDDEAARAELALAGGTALMADGVLTTAIVGGSGGARVKLDFRGSPNAAVEALSQTEEGLTLLALAANHFRPDLPPGKERLPQVDLAAVDKALRDSAGTKIAMTERYVASIAALAEIADEDDDDGEDGDDLKPTDEDIMLDHVKRLPDDIQNVLHEAEEIQRLRDELAYKTPLFSGQDRAAMTGSLATVLTVLGGLA